MKKITVLGENVRSDGSRCVEEDRDHKRGDILTALQWKRRKERKRKRKRERGEKRAREESERDFGAAERLGKLKNLGNIKDVLTRQRGERGG